MAVVGLARPQLPTLAPLAMAEPIPPTFEAALAELESIVERMEGGELPLKESLAAYKRGAELLQYCQAALKDAQQEVLVLEKGVLKAFKADGVDEA
jgi:exodeoxyribonuclease VII small subunit